MFDLGPSPALPCALQQHPNFAAALRAYGNNPIWLDGQTLALSRRLRGGIGLAMLPRAQFKTPQHLPEMLKTAGLHRHLILLSPDRPTPALERIGAVPVMTPGIQAGIDLTQPLEKRHANLHQKWRNRLRHAQKHSLQVKRQNMPLKTDHWLLRADMAHQKIVNYRNWPTHLTIAYASQTPGAAKLFTAFENGQAVAAMLFLRHGRGASYHVGQTTTRGRALSAHNLLLWQAAQWLATKGHDHLDLGLIDTRNASGLARFKLGAGAQARQLGGTWAWWPPLGKSLGLLAAMDRHMMRD